MPEPALSTHPNRYETRFQETLSAGKKIFIPFALLGWPSTDKCFELIKTFIDNGATALEVGFPFSDPMADGPIIQKAGVEALENGFKMEDGFQILAKVREYDPEIPIGLLIYYNMVLAKGIEPFFKRMADVGADAVLIADLPVELVEEVHPIGQKYGIQLVLMVSPLTSLERFAQISHYAGGFIYVVSRLGVTGVSEQTDDELGNLLQRLRQHTSLPLCVGFGVSTPQHAQQMLALGADGFVTASRIIQLMNTAPPGEEKALVTQFLQDMVKTATGTP